jgi:uncharacterized membrane protein YfcA
MVDLSPIQIGLLLAAVFAVAFFYSSVGHGGATGYLAVLALIGVAPMSARVAVLIANILVAGIAWWRFRQAGHFDWRVLLSFAVVSVPCAWLGSNVHISPQVYKIVLGAVLTAAGLILLFRSRWQTDEVALRKYFLPLALLIGAVLGFLAGLTGIGGGLHRAQFHRRTGRHGLGKNHARRAAALAHAAGRHRRVARHALRHAALEQHHLQPRAGRRADFCRRKIVD